MSKTHLIRSVRETKFYARKPVVDKAWLNEVDKNLSELNFVSALTFGWVCFEVAWLIYELIKASKKRGDGNG